MKKLFYKGMIALTATIAFAFTTTNQEKVYHVDTKKSNSNWIGTKVTGAHNGKINISNGVIDSDGKSISKGVIEFDMNSITNIDLTDKGYNDKLIGHLKSEDFFSVAKHPTSTFEITSVKLKSGENYDVTGKLTIKGITNEITFPAVIKITPKMIIAIAKITVNRVKFDIKYGSASVFDNIGDKAISDDFILDVNIIANVASK
jgi:polyisoprenoid-binding protein YceI